MYHKQKIVGSGRIQIIISVIKNHYYILKSILHKRQGSEFTSVLLEYLKTYFHKVEFSVILKSRKCIKITANMRVVLSAGVELFNELHIIREMLLNRKQSKYMSLSTKNYQQKVMYCNLNIQ